ncbi:hypothetical protein BD410DRAFT_873635 [Rickenella mellea]|uniref:DUF6533 domain-containing protein n=1 Tax=Rickenella mellea TaxID=50990 RepID=A0A4Y7PWM8_9AGAM|nr:hypothetical protein BD410DRAFT_873635 [Rickenella mellea]
MSHSPANELQELLDAVGDLRITRANATKALSLSAMVALLYDVILSFPDEVQYIWRAPSSWGKTLYFASRYPIPAMYIVWELYIMGFGVSLPNHQLTVVLGLRTIAIWERDRRIVALVVLGTVVYNITVLIGDALLSRQYHCSSFSRLISTMLSDYIRISIGIDHAQPMNLIRLDIEQSRAQPPFADQIGRGQLIIILLRDGAMYYAAIFGNLTPQLNYLESNKSSIYAGFSIVNVILTYFVSLTRIMLSNALAPAMLAAQSVGACHIILNLRKYSYRQGRYGSIRTPERRTLWEELSTTVTDGGSNGIQLWVR